MAKKTIQTVDKDGFQYKRHNVSINHGKDSIGSVDSFNPQTFDELKRGIEANIDTEAHVLVLYEAALAVELQAAARRARTGGKMPQSEVERIYAQMSQDDKRTLTYTQLMTKIASMYRDEQTTSNTDDAEAIDNEDT